MKHLVHNSDALENEQVIVFKPILTVLRCHMFIFAFYL